MEKVITNLRSRLGEKIDFSIKSGKRIFASVPKEELRSVVELLFKEMEIRFSTATAVETRSTIEILYHFPFDKEGFVLSVRIAAGKPDPEFDSIVDIIEGAEWIEREIHELFGVNFAGHPKMERLLLPDDWPEGDYPFLKKTFDSENEAPERN